MNRITGLEKFKEYFKDFKDNYIIVGGTACNILFSKVGLDFRSTKDIDIVLVTENISKDFVNRFWKFIKDGMYKIYYSKDECPHYYRFINDNNNEYPYMIELFSKKQDIFSEKNSTIIPVVIGDDVSSLSAILLDEAYYDFLLSGKIIVDELPILEVTHLIGFKARAHVDLTNKKKIGIFVNERDSKKHKNDIFRLLQLTNFNTKVNNFDIVKKDIRTFLTLIDENLDVKKITNNALDYSQAVELLKKIYNL